MGHIAKTVETALWIDDDPFMLDCGARALETLGYKPLTAASGADAQQIYARHHDTISLVVLDTMVSNMDGHEAYNVLTLINPGVKMLIISGCNDDDLMRGFFNRGDVEFIQEPFTLDTLSRKIDTLLDGTPSNYTALGAAVVHGQSNQPAQLLN